MSILYNNYIQSYMKKDIILYNCTTYNLYFSKYDIMV